jgi:hypothetical protein
MTCPLGNPVQGGAELVNLLPSPPSPFSSREPSASKKGKAVSVPRKDGGNQATIRQPAFTQPALKTTQRFGKCIFLKRNKTRDKLKRE